jgi:hypothetical protein
MLAHGVDLDVAHQHHALVALLEHGAAHQIVDRLTVAPHEPAERRLHPRGSTHETLSLRVFTQQL